MATSAEQKAARDAAKDAERVEEKPPAGIDVNDDEAVREEQASRISSGRPKASKPDVFEAADARAVREAAEATQE